MRRPLLASLILGVLAASAAADEPRVVFEDRFEGRLAEGWTWLRENRQAWRIRDNALEMRILPQPENILARPLPDPAAGPFAIEVRLTNLTLPTRQYEQAGLTWYRDGKEAFKFVKERIDGQLYVFPGKQEMTEPTVQLRIEVRGEKFTGQYRPGGEGEWRTAFSGQVPASDGGQHRISLICYHGPEDAEHWVRFENFRIVRLPD